MKVENINIRKANLEDVKSNLLDIYIDGYKYHYESRPDIFPNKNEEDLKNALINTIKKSNLLILENSNKILGYVVYQIKEEHNKIMWVNQLVIDKNNRQSGNGKKLMDKIKEIAKEELCQRIELNCWSFNKNALDMYNHIGFKNQRVIFESDI